MATPQKLEKIGRYQILEKVGKGGMGVLYRGFDPVLDREVAIKLMHADFSDDTEQMRPRFYREARAAAKLQHRNIVTIHEFAEESNIPYIVMEFLKGLPLGARMKQTPELTLDDKLNVIAQLCDGLSYAHEQGVVHRDVKPDNVFILEDGSVKLLDFGIAKLQTSTLTRQGDVLGSASYMSPEQVAGSESVDGRADVFSTGVVLYELLSGRKPFEGDSPTAVIVKILKEEPTPIETITTGLPPEVVAVVVRALEKDPADRYQTAEALGRDLQTVRKGLHPSTSKPAMDETRFASTEVMRALHADYQKGRGGKSDTSLTSAMTVAAVGAGGATAAEAPARPAWMVPAAIGAAVLILGGVFLMSRGSSSPPASAPATASSGTTSGSSAPAASGAATGDAATAAAPAAPPSAGGSAASGAAAEVPAANLASPSASTPAAGSAAPAAATAAAKPAPEPKKAPAPAATVAVNLTGNYPFEVVDGSRTISPAATSHELKQPAGKMLTLRAPNYFFSQTVRVEGSTNQPFDFSVPGLGSLDVRSAQETCDIVIGNKKLGNPPLVIKEIAAGSYKVDVVCGTDVVKTHYATVRAGQTYVAAIR